MLITSRYGGRCTSCRENIQAGTQVEWDKWAKTIRHSPYCAKLQQPVLANQAIPPGTGTCELTGRSDHGCQDWMPGQVIPNSPRRIAAGERPFLYVMQTYKKFREDGGLLFQAVCRFATGDEAEEYVPMPPAPSVHGAAAQIE
jgi:hypothetical protein